MKLRRGKPIKIKPYRIYNRPRSFDEISVLFNFPMALQTGLAKSDPEDHPMNIESFIDTIRSLLDEEDAKIVKFIQVDDRNSDDPKIYSQTIFDAINDEAS